MKKLLLTLLVLSCTHYAPGMLRKVARVVTKKIMLNKIRTICRVARQRFFHATPSFKDMNGEKEAQYQFAQEQRFAEIRNGVIENIKIHCEQIGITVYIEKTNSWFDSLKLKKFEDDSMVFYLPNHTYDFYEYYNCCNANVSMSGYMVGRDYAQKFFKQAKELGIKFDGKTKEQETLLHLAAKEGRNSLLKIYLNPKNEIGLQANINDKNAQGNTALHLGASCGVTQELIYNGAQTDIQNNDGDTPLHLAVRNVEDLAVESLVKFDRGYFSKKKNDYISESRHIKNNKGEIPYDYLKNYETKFLSQEARYIKNLLTREP